MYNVNELIAKTNKKPDGIINIQHPLLPSVFCLYQLLLYTYTKEWFHYKVASISSKKDLSMAMIINKFLLNTLVKRIQHLATIL